MAAPARRIGPPLINMAIGSAASTPSRCAREGGQRSRATLAKSALGRQNSDRVDFIDGARAYLFGISTERHFPLSPMLWIAPFRLFCRYEPVGDFSKGQLGL